MGEDKSFVSFRGRPLIESVIEKLNGLGDELLLITNKPDEYAHLELPMFSDIYPDHGSLGGIFTAIKYAAHPYTLVVACDMPWLNRPLLKHMISLTSQSAGATTADVIVPRWRKYPEPLHAIYSKACLDPIEEKLNSGRLKITGFFSKVRVSFIEPEVIARYDAEGRSFANINTMQDLADLEK